MFELRPRADDGARGTTRRSACLKMKAGGDALDKALRDDVHIARFMRVPAKENGFDIEGVAARGDRVFLGLRGPVLRGWALLLELQVKEPKRGRLKLRKVGDDGARYLKHFLDLGGLGIRELAFDGDALLILAGPTMDLDGPVVLYRWPGALDAGEQAVVPADRLESVLHLPYGRGEHHAEGICTAGLRATARSCWWCTIRPPPADCTPAPRSMPTCSGSRVPARPGRAPGAGAARRDPLPERRDEPAAAVRDCARSDLKAVLEIYAREVREGRPSS